MDVLAKSIDLTGVAPKYNCINIIKLVRTNPGITRSEISSSLSISFALTNMYVTQLLEKGWLVTLSKSASQRGRKSGELGVDCSKASILCVVVGSQNMASRLFNLEGKVLHSNTEPLEPAENQATYLERLAQKISAVKNRAEAGTAKVVPVICLNGAVIRDYGMVMSLNGIRDWQPISLKNFFLSHSGIEFHFMSQSCAFMHHLAFSSGIRNFIYLQLFPNITFGALENGTITKGLVGTAGPLSHLGLLSDGAVCSCGQRGCLETLPDFRSRWEAVRDKVLPSLRALHGPEFVFVNPSPESGKEYSEAAGQDIRFVTPEPDDILAGAMHFGAGTLLENTQLL